MPHKSQAEVFIRTLAELLDDERECRKARRRLQHKDHADRFVQAFWARRDGGWRTEPEAARHVGND